MPIFLKNFHALGSDVLEHLIKKKLPENEKKSYNEELKQFAVTLKYYSQRPMIMFEKS